jgi:hypothetical protein
LPYEPVSAAERTGHDVGKKKYITKDYVQKIMKVLDTT